MSSIPHWRNMPQYSKFFQACCVFTSRSLVTASNTGNSSASALKSTLNVGSRPTHNLPYRTNLIAPVVLLITPRHGLRRQHRLFSYANCFCGNLLNEPFPSSGHLFLLIKNLLPNNRHRYVVFYRCLETNVVLEPFAGNGCFSGSTVLALEKTYNNISLHKH
jgi:hypothetical protein